MASFAESARSTIFPAAARRLNRLSAALAVGALAVAALALASYPLGLPFLRTAGRDIEAQVNTGLGLAAVAMAVLLAPRAGRLPRALAAALALAGAALGAATLLEHALGLDLGIDGLLQPETVPGPGATNLGRMGLPAALALLATGLAVALLATGRTARVRLAHLIVFAVLPVALLGVVGHAYDVALLYGAPTTSAVSVPVAVAVLLVELAVVLALPERGLLASLAGADSASALARRMLAYALAVPVTVGGLVVLAAGERRSALHVSVLVVALTVALVLLVLRDARAIERLEAARRRAQRERAESRGELARALERERAARLQAEQASRARDEFLATLSHELRTPLNAILGWALLLRDGRGSAERSARGLASIERNARSLAAVVSDLLDMSRAAAGTLEVSRDDVDLGAAVERALAALRPAAESRGVAVAVAPPAARVRVTGDAARLEQVTWNLVSNAVRFSPPGGRVHVGIAVEAGRAVLEVRDEGAGMAPAFLARVFEPFVQADASPSRAHGGLGIGLAITRTIVAAHGGEISASSAGLGLGSTFRVALPGARLETAGPAGAADLSGARVLVVDDEPDSRDVLVQLLASWGARPVGAASAREALDACGRERPDLVLSDIAMPGEDGLALVAELRRREETAHVPAAALTAFSRPEDRALALAAGFDAHLGKPVEPATLRTTLGELLRRARGAARAAAPAAAAG